jgi:hypothetical protein
MQLDLTDEEAAALLSLLNRVIGDDRYPNAPRTYTWASTVRWSAASLEDMLCVERRHVDPTGFVAARKPPYAQAAYWQALLASNWD